MQKCYHDWLQAGPAKSKTIGFMVWVQAWVKEEIASATTWTQISYKQYPYGQGLHAMPSLEQLPGLEMSDSTKDSKGSQLTLMLIVET